MKETFDWKYSCVSNFYLFSILSVQDWYEQKFWIKNYRNCAHWSPIRGLENLVKNLVHFNLQDWHLDEVLFCSNCTQWLWWWLTMNMEFLLIGRHKNALKTMQLDKTVNKITRLFHGHLERTAYKLRATKIKHSHWSTGHSTQLWLAEKRQTNL